MNTFTSYRANAYMPATGTFHLQDGKKIGDYPLIDFFINFKVRQARIFLKWEHINSGWLDYNYYAAPGYPLADRLIRLGLQWQFYH